MKNTIKNIFGIIALAAAVGFVVVACDKSESSDTAATDTASGQLSGTYVDEGGEVSYTFSGNKMTMSHGGHDHEYTFEVKEGKLIVTTEHGATESDFSLEGDKLTLVTEGETLVLTKKL
jgi:hypothetical protein